MGAHRPASRYGKTLRSSELEHDLAGITETVYSRYVARTWGAHSFVVELTQANRKASGRICVQASSRKPRERLVGGAKRPIAVIGSPTEQYVRECSDRFQVGRNDRPKHVAIASNGRRKAYLHTRPLVALKSAVAPKINS